MRLNKYHTLSLTISIVLLGISVYLYISKMVNVKGEIDESVSETPTQIEIELEYIVQGKWEDRLYEQYEMNQQRGLRKLRHLFWWIQVASEEDRQEIKQAYQIDIPELDFDDHYYILSFGRKLNGVKYYNEKSTKSGGIYTEVDIDFSEDHPDSDVMLEREGGRFISVSELKARNVYIYAMDKTALMDTRIDFEDLIFLNYNYAEKNLEEMPITYIDKAEGEWEEELESIYIYRNARKLRHEGIAWWYQIYGDWEYYQEEFNIQGQELELGGGEYIISFGRKIEHLWYSTSCSDHGYGKEHYAKAAFNMEQYDPTAVYIYKLEHRVNFIDTTLDDGDLQKFNFVEAF